MSDDATEPVLPVEVLQLPHIADQLRALADHLQLVSTYTESHKFRDLEVAWEKSGADPEVDAQLDEAYATAMRQTLLGLAQFRRSYEYWERLIAEYALKSGFTQREAASYLGVAVSTINRWAQHPLTTEDQR